MNTSLPGLQEPFALEVLKQCQESNTPAAVVLINGTWHRIVSVGAANFGACVNYCFASCLGGAVAFDPIASDASAIVEAFYPSVRGAEALHAALFGKENRWGKLPVTLYNKDFPNEVDFTNFDMAKSPGRTYKYYTGTPLFEFGHGLSYAEFDVACSATPKPSNKTIIDCEVTVSQDSAFPSGEEVLMAFHRLPLSVKADATHPTPIKELVAFERVHVSPKGSVSLSIGPNQLGTFAKFVCTNALSTLTQFWFGIGMVDQDGNRVLPPGDHVIEVTNGNNFAQNFTVTVNVCSNCSYFKHKCCWLYGAANCNVWWLVIRILVTGPSCWTPCPPCRLDEQQVLQQNCFLLWRTVARLGIDMNGIRRDIVSLVRLKFMNEDLIVLVQQRNDFSVWRRCSARPFSPRGRFVYRCGKVGR